MTASAKLDAYLDTQPGRCRSCRWHMETQGHHPSCGERQRDVAFDRLDKGRDAASETALLRREVLALAHRKMEFTADDLPADVRKTTNPNRRGRVFAALVEDGLLRVVGESKSRNPKAHGKPVNVYRLRT